MTNGNFDFKDEIVRGNYARKLRDYFERYGVSLSEWWISASPTKAEILIHPLTGLSENEREISRVSLQIDENKYPGKISFGISGYNYKKGEEIRKIFSFRGYDYNIHKQKPKEKDKDKSEEEQERKHGRWWCTAPFNNLEKIAEEFNQIRFILK